MKVSETAPLSVSQIPMCTGRTLVISGTDPVAHQSHRTQECVIALFSSCSQHAPCKRSSQNRGQSGPRSLRPQLTCHKHCKDTPHVDSLNVHSRQPKRDGTITSKTRRVLCHAPYCFRLSPPWAFPLCDHFVCRRQRAELPPCISTSGGIFSSVKKFKLLRLCKPITSSIGPKWAIETLERTPYKQ